METERFDWDRRLGGARMTRRYVTALCAVVRAIVLGGGLIAVTWWAATPIEPIVVIPQPAPTEGRPAAPDNVGTGHFRLVLHGDAKNVKTGGQLSQSIFESEDGTKVFEDIESFASEDDARAALDVRIRRSRRSTPFTKLCDERGHRVGVRVILEGRLRSVDGSGTAVIWSVGPQIYTIQSASHEAALQFEREAPSGPVRACE